MSLCRAPRLKLNPCPPAPGYIYVCFGNSCAPCPCPAVCLTSSIKGANIADYLEPLNSISFPHAKISLLTDYTRFVSDFLVAQARCLDAYHNLILHGRVGGGGSGGSAGAGIRVLVAARLEVVGHLRVELLGRLLGRASALTTALLVGASLADGAGLARVGVLLAGGGRLGLSLGLTVWSISNSETIGSVGQHSRGTLGKGLDGRDNLVGLGSAHNDLDLFGPVSDVRSLPSPRALTLIGRLSTSRPLSFWKALLAPSGLWKATLAIPRLCELGPYTRSTLLIGPTAWTKYSCGGKSVNENRRVESQMPSPSSSVVVHRPKTAIESSRECGRRDQASKAVSFNSVASLVREQATCLHRLFVSGLNRVGNALD